MSRQNSFDVKSLCYGRLLHLSLLFMPSLGNGKTTRIRLSFLWRELSSPDGKKSSDKRANKVRCQNDGAAFFLRSSYDWVIMRWVEIVEKFNSITGKFSRRLTRTRTRNFPFSRSHSQGIKRLAHLAKWENETTKMNQASNESINRARGGDSEKYQLDWIETRRKFD